MILCDVNVLIYAHKEGTDRHRDFHQWVTDVVNGDEPYGVSDQVLSGFPRIVTNRRVFERPAGSPRLSRSPTRCATTPTPCPCSPAHATGSCSCGSATTGMRPDLVPDAWFAALAIEAGCQWVTTDRDFARFPGLRWSHPLDG